MRIPIERWSSEISIHQSWVWAVCRHLWALVTLNTAKHTFFLKLQSKLWCFACVKCFTMFSCWDYYCQAVTHKVNM